MGRLVLPKKVYNHFDLIQKVATDKDIHFCLDETGIPPRSTGFVSKGFTEQRIIQDFPLRGKAIYLHIRRRKWQNIITGQVVTNSYDLTHLGAQIAKEFAD